MDNCKHFALFLIFFWQLIIDREGKERFYWHLKIVSDPWPNLKDSLLCFLKLASLTIGLLARGIISGNMSSKNSAVWLLREEFVFESSQEECGLLERLESHARSFMESSSPLNHEDRFLLKYGETCPRLPLLSSSSAGLDKWKTSPAIRRFILAKGLLIGEGLTIFGASEFSLYNVWVFRFSCSINDLACDSSLSNSPHSCELSKSNSSRSSHTTEFFEDMFPEIIPRASNPLVKDANFRKHNKESFKFGHGSETILRCQ